MKKKILFVNHVAGSGGAEQSLIELATTFLQEGLEVHTALPCQGFLAKTLSAFNIPVDLFPLRPLKRRPLVYGICNYLVNLFASVPALKKIIKTRKIEIVHANSNIAQLLAGRAAKACGIPSIWHCRYLHHIGIERFLLNSFSSIIAVSNAVAAFLIKNGFPPEKISVIYNGINHEKFVNSGAKGTFRRAMNISPDSFVVLMVAHMAPWKHHDVFIKSAQLVLQKIPSALFVIAGDDIYNNNASYFAELKKLIHKLNISDRIIFMGNVYDIRPLLYDADCLVHPADREPFGRIIIEAMACGLPVVASNNGGPAEIIEHNKSGILVKQNDIEAFADAIIKVITNRQLARMLSGAGILRAKDFDIKTTAKKIMQIYNSIN